MVKNDSIESLKDYEDINLAAFDLVIGPIISFCYTFGIKKERHKAALFNDFYLELLHQC